jgi:hypothetical protein
LKAPAAEHPFGGKKVKAVSLQTQVKDIGGAFTTLTGGFENSD